MALGGKRPGAGRKKGSTTKATQDVKALVDQIFARHDPIETASALLTCGNPGVIVKVWQTLIEYRFGKPTERHEHTGLEGAPMAVEHTIKFGDDKSER